MFRLSRYTSRAGSLLSQQCSKQLPSLQQQKRTLDFPDYHPRDLRNYFLTDDEQYALCRMDNLADIPFPMEMEMDCFSTISLGSCQCFLFGENTAQTQYPRSSSRLMETDQRKMTIAYSMPSFPEFRNVHGGAICLMFTLQNLGKDGMKKL